MATTPMTFKIEIQQDEWRNHLLCKLWNNIPFSHPIYGSHGSIRLFLKQEYNINTISIRYKLLDDTVMIEFKSTQDYILWQLHQ